MALVQYDGDSNRSGVYADAGGRGRMLRPEHVGSDDEEEEEEEEDDAPGTQTRPDLTARETDGVLRALFSHYNEGNVDAGQGQMSAGKFYKLVRECDLMDARVSQVPLPPPI